MILRSNLKECGKKQVYHSNGLQQYLGMRHYALLLAG